GSTSAPWQIALEDAVTKDGWILGRRMLTLHDAGAYSRFSPYGLTKHAFHHTGAYTIPNLHFDGFVCYTNRVPTTAMRGFGVTSVSFATETHLSRIADVLGLDPWELRLKNANQNGDPSQAWIKLKPDGRVDVFSGTVDIGQGSKTVHTQIVADALGVPYDWVTMDNTNTDSSAVCTGTFASRGTFIGGNAVRLAAERVRERILDIASKELEIDASDLEIADGQVTAKGAPQKTINVADVAGAATYNYGELIRGSSTALKPFEDVDIEPGRVEIETKSA